MNTRQWGGMLFLVMALLLMGYGQTQKNAALRIRSQGEQVWGGGAKECVGTRYDCPDPKYNNCVPATGICYQCYGVVTWTGCVTYKDNTKSCTVTGTGAWCGRLKSGVLNANNTCGACGTVTGINCGVQAGATGDGCDVGPPPQ